jgi:hypothetical protein
MYCVSKGLHALPSDGRKDFQSQGTCATVREMQYVHPFLIFLPSGLFCILEAHQPEDLGGTGMTPLARERAGPLWRTGRDRLQ